MAKTTFGAEFRRLRNERNFTLQKLSELYYGHEKNTIVFWRLDHSQLPYEDKEISEYRLKRCSEIMNLPYHEQMLLYGLANHIPPTTMPSEAQIQNVFETVKKELLEYPYPAYVLDRMYFRFWLANSAIITLIGGTEKIEEFKNCSVFDFMYDPKWGVFHMLDAANLENLQKSQVARFKTLNVVHQHEDFYMEYPEVLKESLGEAYATFEQHWHEITVSDQGVHHNVVTFQAGSQSVSFRFIPEPVWALGDLFALVRYLPCTEQDIAFCNMFFSHVEKACHEIWTLGGAVHKSILCSSPAPNGVLSEAEGVDTTARKNTRKKSTTKR